MKDITCPLKGCRWVYHRYKGKTKEGLLDLEEVVRQHLSEWHTENEILSYFTRAELIAMINKSLLASEIAKIVTPKLVRKMTQR